MTVDHEKLRREHPLNDLSGRPSFTQHEHRALLRDYDGCPMTADELRAVADHRRSEPEGRRALVHQPSPHHPCPLCRLDAAIEALKWYAEAGRYDWQESEGEDEVVGWTEAGDEDRGKRARAALGSQVDTPAEGSES